MLLGAILWAVSCMYADGQTTTPPSYPGTTMEEYNYITKGYKTTVDQGLDLKAGYRTEVLSPVFKFTNADHTLQLVKLIRSADGASNSYAAIMVLHTMAGKLNRVYCIPNNFADVGIKTIALEDVKNNIYGSLEDMYINMLTSTLVRCP